MKNFYRIMVVVGMLFVATSCFAGVTQDSSELVLTLSSTRDGRPVYAVYSKKFKHIFLRLPELSTKAGEGVDFLQRQVESLIFKTGQRTKLSDGYVLVFDGGYPVWGPYHELTKEGEFVCLQFSEKVSLKGNPFQRDGLKGREILSLQSLMSKARGWTQKEEANAEHRKGFFSISTLKN